MIKIINLFKKWISRKKSPSQDKDFLSLLFQFKYSCFKELLLSNTELLKGMSDIEDKLQGRQVFGMSFVRTHSSRAIFHALRMIKYLDDFSLIIGLFIVCPFTSNA
jgi:pyruvate,water dikinase